MAYIVIPNTFTNGTAADGTAVNTNFTTISGGLSDGTKDLNVNAIAMAASATVGGTLQVTGATTLNGAVTLGNAAGDTITHTGTAPSILLDNGVADGGTIYMNGNTATLQCSADGTTVTGGGTITAVNLPVVACRYTSNAAQAFIAGATTINFEDVEFDTHSAVTTGANWVFTAPFTGKYLVSVGVYSQARAWLAGDSFYLVIRVAGASYAIPSIKIFDAAINTLAWCGGSVLVAMTAAQDLDVRLTSSNAGNLDNSPYTNYISIHMIGV